MGAVRMRIVRRMKNAVTRSDSALEPHVNPSERVLVVAVPVVPVKGRETAPLEKCAVWTPSVDSSEAEEKGRVRANAVVWMKN